MTDPRNIAHDKKVQQEKKHRHEEIAHDPTHAVQPGRKPRLEHVEKPEQSEITPPPADSPKDGEQMQG